MVRTKNFSRESVLKKATPLFWRKGYTDTSIQDLEKATGVNKSGLYSEFENKEELYLACIKYFADNKSGKSALLPRPYGWKNVEAFLNLIATHDTKEQKGCFLIYSMREFKNLPETVESRIELQLQEIRALLIENISAESTKNSAETIANIVINIFAGAALLQNVQGLEKAERNESVSAIMSMIRNL